MKTVYLSCVVALTCLTSSGCQRDNTQEPRPIVDPNKPVRALLSIRGTGIKGIPGSSGEIVYYPRSSDSLKATVTLRGLKKSYSYVLALNGKRGKEGNEILKQRGEEDRGEGVVNVDISPTDPNGNWHGEFPFVQLPPGYYNIKFLVKDPLDSGWITIMRYDNLGFEIVQ
jgi:hypothetical protein